MNPDINAKVDALLLDGLSPKEIRRVVKCHGSLISNRRNKLGIPKFPRGRSETKKGAAIKQLLSSGKLPREIIAELGVTQVSYYSKKLGIEFKSGRPLGVVGEKTSAILESNGKSQVALAKQFRVTRQRIGQIFSPEKHRCRCALHKAIKEGSIVRPSFCSDCKRPCKPDAHHADYSKPFEVAWLCKRCHGKEHRRLRSLALTT